MTGMHARSECSLRPYWRFPQVNICLITLDMLREGKLRGTLRNRFGNSVRSQARTVSGAACDMGKAEQGR